MSRIVNFCLAHAVSAFAVLGIASSVLGVAKLAIFSDASVVQILLIWPDALTLDSEFKRIFLILVWVAIGQRFLEVLF